MKRRIVFLTGTRADYGKIKPLIEVLGNSEDFEVHVFVTGIHLLEKYGGTARVIMKDFSNIYLYNNQSFNSKMEIVLSNTIYGFSHYIDEINPDLIVVHGDRPETLAGSIVGSFKNILVAHIEGGEVSGTIDELIRHSVTKLSHLHFVANDKSKSRVVQLGEDPQTIFVIGSPDIDVMMSGNLPSIKEVKRHYEIDFREFAIAVYHPITTNVSAIKKQVKIFFDCLIKSRLKYIIIYPNNDVGCDLIIDQIEKNRSNKNLRIFPSVEFESFLTLLKHSKFVIGNSSLGIREAPIYGVPSINIGKRQFRRSNNVSILNVELDEKSINKAIKEALDNVTNIEPTKEFGHGNSAKEFLRVLENEDFWDTKIQKFFRDR